MASRALTMVAPGLLIARLSCFLGGGLPLSPLSCCYRTPSLLPLPRDILCTPANLAYPASGVGC